MNFPNAITDQRLVPYPATPPDLGGAGSVIVDPFCGNRILRVTDANSDPARPGMNWVTPSSSAAQPWAADSSACIVGDQGGGWWLVRFDPESFAGQLGPKTPAMTTFSEQDSDLMYGISALTIRTWQPSTNKLETVFDVRDYPEIPVPAEPRWYLNSLSVDWSDNRIAVNLGPGQDKNWFVLVWDVDLGLAWLRTDTGEYGGWGNAGQIPNWPGNLLLHDSRISRSGTTVKLGFQNTPTQAVTFWRPGTGSFQMTLQSSEVPVCLGHQNMGFSTFYGADLRTVPFQWIQAPLWALPAWQNLQKPVPKPVANWWDDWHMSVCADPQDRNPLFISTVNSQRNPTNGGPPTANAPGDNEILAMSVDGTGRWWRLAHTYSTGRGNFWSTPRGNVSPDGRFFLFTSDWQLTLGGTQPQQRVDAFLLKMR